jgi:VanZ family protein
MSPPPTPAPHPSRRATAAAPGHDLPGTAANNWSDALALIWFLGVALATLLPAERLPVVPGSDKTHHLVAYGMLCLLAGWRRAEPRALLGLFIAATAFGGMVEMVQPFINRWGEWGDFVANACGAALGCGGAFLLRQVEARLRKRTAAPDRPET